MKKLSEKDKKFCREYLIDLNGTQAAIRTGFSAKTARQNAWRLLQQENVQAYLQKLIDKRNKRLDLSADYVLENIKNIGEKCMAEENKENPALKAQELLGRHLKLFGDDAANSTRPVVVMPAIKVGDTEITFDIGEDPNNS